MTTVDGRYEVVCLCLKFLENYIDGKTNDIECLDGIKRLKEIHETLKDVNIKGKVK